ncbi:MAG: metal ABC transporter permease [Thermodesulfobacteriota bacterium]|nr:metal ABC transporter permease [Thermodesulfobacteriota bacterium]
MTMESLLSYAFMQRALLAGFLISITCAILGVFLVLRRDAMIGHGLAHVTFGGVALGLFLYLTPLLVALGVAVFSALGILKLKERAGLYGDTAIGIISSLGMALGIILVSLAGSFNVDLFGYLFGNILAIDPEEVWMALILALVVLITIVLFYQEFVFLTFDPESARTSGVQVRRLDKLMAILTAVTVVLGMKVVGILLVSALLVMPAAAALQVARSFKEALMISASVAGISAIAGLVIAFYFDWPASGTIVAVSGLFFLVLFQARSYRKPAQEELNERV